MTLLYVADWGGHRIVVLDPTANRAQRHSFGKKGRAPGQLMYSRETWHLSLATTRCSSQTRTTIGCRSRRLQECSCARSAGLSSRMLPSPPATTAALPSSRRWAPVSASCPCAAVASRCRRGRPSPARAAPAVRSPPTSRARVGAVQSSWEVRSASGAAAPDAGSASRAAREPAPPSPGLSATSSAVPAVALDEPDEDDPRTRPSPRRRPRRRHWWRGSPPPSRHRQGGGGVAVAAGRRHEAVAVAEGKLLIADAPSGTSHRRCTRRSPQGPPRGQSWRDRRWGRIPRYSVGCSRVIVGTPSVFTHALRRGATRDVAVVFQRSHHHHRSWWQRVTSPSPSPEVNGSTALLPVVPLSVVVTPR